MDSRPGSRRRRGPAHAEPSRPAADVLVPQSALEVTVDWGSLLQAVISGHVRVIIEDQFGGRAVLVGEDQLVSPAASLAHDASPFSPANPTLSRREQQVLRLLETGRSGTEIATELQLAVNTVAQHLASARRKLGVRNSPDAATRARHLGLL